MPSLRARLVELALPLLGIKRFFSEPDRMDARIAGLRRQPPVRPRKKRYRQFDILESYDRGYPVVTILPKHGSGERAPHILYLHGGGYVMDIAAVHWEAVFRLCERLGASATVPIYPLAPEHKAIATVDQMRELYGTLCETYGAACLTVMGDSAGGGMALALAQRLTQDGGEQPASLVLYSPWLDATGSGVGQQDIEHVDRMLSIEGLDACGKRYAGDLPLEDPLVSPLFGNLDGLAPMAIFAGTHDVLLVDARRLAELLSEPGKPEHVYREYEGMCHVWMLLPVPEAKRALDETAEFIASHFREKLA